MGGLQMFVLPSNTKDLPQGGESGSSLPERLTAPRKRCDASGISRRKARLSRSSPPPAAVSRLACPEWALARSVPTAPHPQGRPAGIPGESEVEHPGQGRLKGPLIGPASFPARGVTCLPHGSGPRSPALTQGQCLQGHRAVGRNSPADVRGLPWGRVCVPGGAPGSGAAITVRGWALARGCLGPPPRRPAGPAALPPSQQPAPTPRGDTRCLCRGPESGEQRKPNPVKEQREAQSRKHRARWGSELTGSWRPRGLDQLLSLLGRARTVRGRVSLASTRAPRGRGSPGTFFQVCRLDGDPRGTVSREVRDVHVEAPDRALDAQPDDAPVVTCGRTGQGVTPRTERAPVPFPRARARAQLNPQWAQEAADPCPSLTSVSLSLSLPLSTNQ